MYKQTVISFLLLFLSFPLFLFSQQPTSSFYKVRLGKVIDGDTFKVYLSCSYKLFCKGISVRVRGIDTPEIKSKNAEEKTKAYRAREYTRKFLQGGKITLKQCTRDKYFRLLCDVKVNGADLATALISNGHAVPYDGGKKK